MNFHLRHTGLTEAAEGVIADLHEASFPGCDPWLDPDGDYWLARTPDGKTAGFAAMLCSRVEKVAYMARSGVLRPFRGQGLQRRLIRVRENWARKEGMKALVSETVNNPVSATNLIREGFLPFKPATPWNENDNVTYWRKELT